MLDWKQEQGLWYCYKDDKKLVSQWVQDENKKWYYLDKDGRMATFWFQTATNGNAWFFAFDKQTINEGKIFYAGEIVTGWLNYKDKWYFLEDTNEDTLGSMYCNGTYTINGKSQTFDKDGVWIESSIQGLSDKGAEFLASWEGITYKWEDVGDGYWTIGIGTATSGTLGKQLYDSGITSCTLEQAKEWARQECASCYETIKAKLDANNITLSQNQVDALISLSYNIGVGGLIKSTLFQNILAGATDANIIRENFGRYNLVNGVVWQGLVNRRKSEADLYLNEDYTGNNQ